MKIRKINALDYTAYKEMAEEYSASGDDRYRKHASWVSSFKEYLEELAKLECRETLPSHLVPSHCFWLFDDSNTLHGSIRLRTELNEVLRIEGGHIGYDVRPGSRNQGYATEMLSQCLGIAFSMNLTQVLVTCFTDNPASARVIEKNGGVLESIEKSPRNGKATKRYWIDLSERPDPQFSAP